ncbi:MAG: hypothetical protein OCU12_01785 [Methanophagales archaeon]|nr:hypothetical protein [Methanophagales archaeon]
MEKAPGWIQKYKERIESGRITAAEIAAAENEAENRERAVPTKISTVARAVNSLGCQISGSEREAGAVVYSCSIGKISKATEERFAATKKSWERDLGKPLENDYFVNLLLALAKLAERGKTLTL